MANCRHGELLMVYPQKKIKFNELDHPVLAVPEVKQRTEVLKHRIIYGHYEYGLHENVNLPGTYRYMAFVRNPILRAISWYNHQTRVPDSKYHDVILRQKLSLDQMLGHSIIAIDNLQVRLFSGKRSGVPFGKIGKDEYVLALQNIEEKFAYVGISEQFDKSFKIITKLLGYTNSIYQDTNVNPKGRADYIAKEYATDKLAELNEWDLKLYDYLNKKYGM